MSERWLHDYTVLALRLNKALEQKAPYAPVEEYQLPEWDGQVLHQKWISWSGPSVASDGSLLRKEVSFIKGRCFW